MKIFRSRTVALTTVASTLVGVALFGGTVFLSQYFQTSLGKSPTVAGLMSLPMILGLLVSSTVAGQLITKYGRWKAYLVAGATVMVVGMLLLATIDTETPCRCCSPTWPCSAPASACSCRTWSWRRRTTCPPTNWGPPPPY